MMGRWEDGKMDCMIDLADCGGLWWIVLDLADCGMRIENCGLRIENCGLIYKYTRLHTLLNSAN